MINQIGKITLYVNNQAEAKSFWLDKMNFVVKLEQPMGPNMTWLEVGPSADAFTSFVLYEKQLMLAQKTRCQCSLSKYHSQHKRHCCYL